MVVGEDDRGGVVRERLLDDLPRVDAGLGERAAEQLVGGEQAMLAVEKQNRRRPRARAVRCAAAGSPAPPPGCSGADRGRAGGPPARGGRGGSPGRRRRLWLLASICELIAALIADANGAYRHQPGSVTTARTTKITSIQAASLSTQT